MNNTNNKPVNPVIPEHQIIAEANDDTFLVDESILILIIAMVTGFFMTLQILFVLILPNDPGWLAYLTNMGITFGLIVLMQKHITFVLPRVIRIYDHKATKQKPATKTFKIDLGKLTRREQQYYK